RSRAFSSARSDAFSIPAGPAGCHAEPGPFAPPASCAQPAPRHGADRHAAAWRPWQRGRRSGTVLLRKRRASPGPPRRRLSKGTTMLRLLRFLLWGFARAVLPLRYRVQVHGLDRVKELKGPTLVLPNHPGFIDPILLLTTLWRTLRPRPMLFEGNFQSPV